MYISQESVSELVFISSPEFQELFPKFAEYLDNFDVYGIILMIISSKINNQPGIEQFPADIYKTAMYAADNKTFEEWKNFLLNDLNFTPLHLKSFLREGVSK